MLQLEWREFMKNSYLIIIISFIVVILIIFAYIQFENGKKDEDSSNFYIELHLNFYNQSYKEYYDNPKDDLRDFLLYIKY